MRSVRTDGKVRQQTLLNPGRHFDIDQAHWPALCQRIEQLIEPRQAMLVALEVIRGGIDAADVQHAQRLELARLPLVLTSTATQAFNASDQMVR